MKLYVLSDIHFEASPSWDFPLNLPEFDVAVIAGDLDCPLQRAVDRIAAASCFTGKPVIMVPGNHEFDGSIFQDALASGVERASAVAGVHLLHRRAAIIGGVRFIGATLWTDYELGGNTRANMIRAGQEMPDHKAIRYREAGGHISRFMPWHTRREHKLDRAFIEHELSVPHEGPTVVVTHHLPSARSIATRFMGSPLNPAFASNLDHLIEAHRPALWIHGHSHHAVDYRIGQTRIVANPKGYGPVQGQSRTDNPSFNELFTIEV